MRNRTWLIVAILGLVAFGNTSTAEAQFYGGYIPLPRGPFPPYGGYGAGFQPGYGGMTNRIQGDYRAGFTPSPVAYDKSGRAIYQQQQQQEVHPVRSRKYRRQVQPQQQQQYVQPPVERQAPPPVPDPPAKNVTPPKKSGAPQKIA